MTCNLTNITERHGPSISKYSDIDYMQYNRGQLNKNVIIDQGNWGITVVDLAISGKNILAWGGHAVVVIESVEPDGYHLRRADIMPWKENPSWAEVRYLEKKDSDDLRKRMRTDPKTGETKEIVVPENFARTKTWIRPKEDVLRMIKVIERQKERFLLGNPEVFFHYYPLIGERRKQNTYNCMEWSKRMLSLAKIKLPTRFLELPLSYTGSYFAIAAREIPLATIVYSGITAVFGAAIGGIIGIFGGPLNAIVGARYGAGIGACIGATTALINSAKDEVVEEMN